MRAGGDLENSLFMPPQKAEAVDETVIEIEAGPHHGGLALARVAGTLGPEHMVPFGVQRDEVAAVEAVALRVVVGVHVGSGLDHGGGPRVGGRNGDGESGMFVIH